MPRHPEFRFINASEMPYGVPVVGTPEPDGTVVHLPDMDAETYAAWDAYAAKHTGHRFAFVRRASDLRVLCAIFLRQRAAGVDLNAPIPSSSQ